MVNEIMRMRADQSVTVSDDRHFAVRMTENSTVSVALGANGHVTVVIQLTPCMISWNIAEGYVSISPIALRGEEQRAIDKSLSLTEHETDERKEAYRVACMGLALSEIDTALRIAVYSPKVDQNVLDFIRRKFADVVEQPKTDIHDMIGRLEREGPFRDLMKYLAGPIYKSIKVEF